MSVKKFVTPDNLSQEHFVFNQAKKKIEVKFPESQSVDLSVEVQDAFGVPIGKMGVVSREDRELTHETE